MAHKAEHRATRAAGPGGLIAEPVAKNRQVRAVLARDRGLGRRVLGRRVRAQPHDVALEQLQLLGLGLGRLDPGPPAVASVSSTRTSNPRCTMRSIIASTVPSAG